MKNSLSFLSGEILNSYVLVTEHKIASLRNAEVKEYKVCIIHINIKDFECWNGAFFVVPVFRRWRRNGSGLQGKPCLYQTLLEVLPPKKRLQVFCESRPPGLMVLQFRGRSTVVELTS